MMRLSSRPALATYFTLFSSACPHGTTAATSACSPAFILPVVRSMSSSSNLLASTAPSRGAGEAELPSAAEIASRLEEVGGNVAAAAKEASRPPDSVRLVAVSKTKPVELLRAAYDAGQRTFGENYAQELYMKAEEMTEDDIEWHFIGPLQSNKAAQLIKRVGLDRLRCVETVATAKLARKLDRAAGEVGGEGGGEGERKKLGIYIQVNTSGEESKSGLTPGGELLDLVRTVADECPNISVDGLMTIGAPGDYGCFDTLAGCREEVAGALGVEPGSLELSMGMSGDYQEAIARGATSVRVGSTIFGARDYSDKK